MLRERFTNVAEAVSGEREQRYEPNLWHFLPLLMPTESELCAASSATQSVAALAFKYANVRISHVYTRIGKLLVPQTEFIPVTQFRLLAREFV